MFEKPDAPRIIRINFQIIVILWNLCEFIFHYRFPFRFRERDQRSPHFLQPFLAATDYNSKQIAKITTHRIHC